MNQQLVAKSHAELGRATQPRAEERAREVRKEGTATFRARCP